MDIEIQISFDKNSIVVQSENLTERFANLIAIDKTTNKFVDIGHTEQEVASYNPDTWQKNKHKIIFEPIFDSRNFDPEKMAVVTRFLIYGFHHKIRGMGFFDKITCHAKMPNYEIFQINAKEHYEFSLESWNKLKALTINGKALILKSWQYGLAKFSLEWGWRIILLLIFIGLEQNAYKASNIIFPHIEKNPIAILLLLIVFVFGVIWLTEISWMFGMQILFPKKTLRRMFAQYQHEFTPTNKFSVSKMLANLILGKYE